MKTTTEQARAMTDEQLAALSLQLRRRIPEDQSLLAAIKREQRRRQRQKAKAA